MPTLLRSSWIITNSVFSREASSAIYAVGRNTAKPVLQTEAS